MTFLSALLNEDNFKNFLEEYSIQIGLKYREPEIIVKYLIEQESEKFVFGLI